MPELSKHELDSLFQRGSERYDFEYKPAAWKQMEAMLERNRRRRALMWRACGLAVLILLATLARCFFFPGTNARHDILNRKAARTETDHGAAGEKAPGHKGQNRNAPYLNDKNAVPRPDNGAPGTAPAEPGRGSRPQAMRPLLRHWEIGEKGTRPVRPLPAAVNPPHPEPEKSSVVPKINTEGPSDKGITVEAPAPLPSLPSAFSPPAIAPEQRDIPPLPGQERQKGRRKPSNRLLAGPAFAAGLNAIGRGSFSESGWKAGLFVEYQYQSRLALSMGASFQRMNYLAGRGEYVPPKGFWTRRIAPDNTRGLCNIIEVPVMLKYYHKGYSGNGPYLSAGLSAYFLLMEEYWYQYSLGDPDLIRWWQTGKNQSYWLAAGQAAAGYQASLGKSWALQLGPYLQVPLSGVGHGQVKIYSLGLEMRLLGKVW